MKAKSSFPAILVLIMSIIIVVAMSADHNRTLRKLATAERQIKAQQARIDYLENRTITEQMKSIQRQVGCKLIDGEIGPETAPLVNAKVRAEKKRAICNQYATAMFERMAGDTK